MRTRGVAQNSLLALAGDLASKAGMLAVMMVAARGLSTSQFAVLAGATAIATVLSAVLDLGSQTLLTRDGVAGVEARGGLLAGLAIARAPLLGLALLLAGVAGIATGRLLEALAIVALATSGAVQLSLTGALRSAQDLRPEAGAKLAGALLTLAAAAACVVLAPRADVLLLALAAAGLLGLAPMLRAARQAISIRGPRPRGLTLLLRAAPLGMMTLATLGYYRAGTIALSLFSSSAQTARFAAASTIAWGLLCAANAVTTGLLPRLAASRDRGDLVTVTRRTLLWITVLAALPAGAVALLAHPLLSILFGGRYSGAAGPLAVMAGATVLIAPAGVLGTALIATGRLRPLAVQVAASLSVNLIVLAVLVGPLGAIGAALATVACEATALVLLAIATHRFLPGVLSRSTGATRISGVPVPSR